MTFFPLLWLECVAFLLCLLGFRKLVHFILIWAMFCMYCMYLQFAVVQECSSALETKVVDLIECETADPHPACPLQYGE